jgi:hypothetical protein
MENDEESWEAVWPPEPPDDPVLIRKAIASIRANPDLHADAWKLVTEGRGLGTNPDLTLLDELYVKSGSVVKSFIDQAIERCFTFPIDPDHLENILEPFEEESDDCALDLYTGCVWELTAMLSSCIIHLSSHSELYASCYAPVERSSSILAYR